MRVFFYLNQGLQHVWFCLVDSEGGITSATLVHRRGGPGMEGLKRWLEKSLNLL